VTRPWRRPCQDHHNLVRFYPDFSLLCLCVCLSLPLSTCLCARAVPHRQMGHSLPFLHLRGQLKPSHPINAPSTSPPAFSSAYQVLVIEYPCCAGSSWGFHSVVLASCPDLDWPAPGPSSFLSLAPGSRLRPGSVSSACMALHAFHPPSWSSGRGLRRSWGDWGRLGSAYWPSSAVPRFYSQPSTWPSASSGSVSSGPWLLAWCATLNPAGHPH
jgi:hypothetical protein